MVGWLLQGRAEAAVLMEWHRRRSTLWRRLLVHDFSGGSLTGAPGPLCTGASGRLRLNSGRGRLMRKCPRGKQKKNYKIIEFIEDRNPRIQEA